MPRGEHGEHRGHSTLLTGIVTRAKKSLNGTAVDGEVWPGGAEVRALLLADVFGTNNALPFLEDPR